MPWLAESVSPRDAIASGTNLRATRVEVGDGFKWSCIEAGEITRESARKEVARIAAEAVEHAVNHGRPFWAQTLTIQLEIPVAVAEAAAKDA